MEQKPKLEKMYTSRFCGHAVMVERFLRKNGIDTELVNIDSDPVARQEVIEINNGFASTPTLIFSDGTHLTEPSFRQLRIALGLQPDSWFAKLLSRLGI